MLFTIPYNIAIIAIPLLLVWLYYIIYQYLLKKLQPRQSGSRLLLFFIIVIAFTMAYMTGAVYGIITIAKAYR